MPTPSGDRLTEAADIFARDSVRRLRPLLAAALAKEPYPCSEGAVDLGALGGTRTPNLLIRRSGHTVQDRLVWSVCWADIPQLFRCVGCCPPAWLQSWLQSRGNGADPRPFAFQTGHIPSSRGSSGSYALLSVAAVSRWLLPLLSAAVRYAPYSR